MDLNWNNSPLLIKSSVSSYKASNEPGWGGSKSMPLLLEDDLRDQSPAYADICISVISKDELG